MEMEKNAVQLIASNTAKALVCVVCTQCELCDQPNIINTHNQKGWSICKKVLAQRSNQLYLFLRNWPEAFSLQIADSVFCSPSCYQLKIFTYSWKCYFCVICPTILGLKWIRSGSSKQNQHLGPLIASCHTTLPPPQPKLAWQQSPFSKGETWQFEGHPRSTHSL